jgi:hypothetical protein
MLLATIAYTYLFYHQSPGINYLLFDLTMVGLLAITQFPSFHRPQVLVSMVGMLSSSVFVFWHNTVAPLLLHWLSFGLFVRLVYEPTLSPYLALAEQTLLTGFNVFRSRAWEKLWPKKEAESKKPWTMYLLTLPIVGVFILLYSSGNALYSQWMSRLFDFEVSFDLFFFFITGLLFSFSVFAPGSSGLWTSFDLLCSNVLSPSEEPPRPSLFGNLSQELRSAVFLLLMLNLVTLSLHLTDLYALLLPDRTSINYSDEVHQGVNSLIVSILLAILIVVYFFRGELNFLQENKWLKGLTYAWLFQNLLLIVSICHKDLLYIYHHGLTHKRIGVLVWLSIVALGLLFTYFKIHEKKSVWYLLRSNTWSVYLILLAYSGIHWDRWIVRYNTSCQCDIDYSYLSQLDVSAIADLNELGLPHKKHIPMEQLNWQNDRRAAFIQEYKGLGWPSFNLESERIASPFTSTK